MNFPLYIARKIYSYTGDRQKVSKPAVRIAIAGVAIGLAVMIISVSVVFGFKHTIQDKVIGFGSHIQVADFMTLQNQEQYPIQMNDSMVRVIRDIPGVAHVQRYAMKQGILKTDKDFLGVMFKGVGPDYDTTFLHKNLVEGTIPRFSDQKSSNHILVSRKMADMLQVKCGDKIFAYFIDQQGVRARRFTIQGIYQTNLTQYDRTICFIDLYTAVKLNGWEPDQASGAEVTVADFSRIDDTESFFIDRINQRNMWRMVLLRAPSALSTPIMVVRSNIIIRRPDTMVTPATASISARIIQTLRSSRLSHWKICGLISWMVLEE